MFFKKYAYGTICLGGLPCVLVFIQFVCSCRSYWLFGWLEEQYTLLELEESSPDLPALMVWCEVVAKSEVLKKHMFGLVLWIRIQKVAPVWIRFRIFWSSSELFHIITEHYQFIPKCEQCFYNLLLKKNSKNIMAHKGSFSTIFSCVDPLCQNSQHWFNTFW